MSEEQKDHQYFSFRETYLSRRKVVAPWMLSVCEFFNLHSTTAHAAIAYLDRLQPNEKFTRVQWKMAAICCIVIASKYNECEDQVPELRRLEEIARQQIPNEILLDYELWALMRMGWKLNARTPIAFLHCHMIQNGGVLKADDVLLNAPSSGDVEANRKETKKNLNTQMESMATTCLLNTEYKRFLASDVAKAIVFVARDQMDNLLSPVWGESLENDIGSVRTASVMEIVAQLKADSMSMNLPAPPSKSQVQNGSAISPITQQQDKKGIMSPTSVGATSSCTPGMDDLYVNQTGQKTAWQQAQAAQEADKENNYYEHITYGGGSKGVNDCI